MQVKILREEVRMHTKCGLKETILVNDVKVEMLEMNIGWEGGCG